MSESVIYGVGDEVIVLLALLITFTFSGWFILYTSNFFSQTMSRIRSMFQDQNFDPPRSTSDSSDSSTHHRAYAEESCPICLSNYTFKIETNCGHNFCGPCMKTYLQHEDFVISTMTCPLCRQPITLLFNSYTDEERSALPDSELGKQRIEMNILINRFNRIAAGTPKTLLQNIYDWPVLIRRLFNELFSRRPMLLFRIRIILLLVCGAVYVFSPVDALPEAAYGILGLIDDALVILFCIWTMSRIRSIIQEINFDAPRFYANALAPDGLAAHGAHAEDSCPICLRNYSFTIETNCGHIFCGPCMKTYLQQEDLIIRTITCPVCQQPVTLLFNMYTEEERNAQPESDLGKERVQINRLIKRFNRIKAGTRKTFIQSLYDWPVLMRRLLNELFSRRLILLFRVKIILLLECAAVYVSSPIDALPEDDYGILGMIDDTLAIFLCLWCMINVYRSFLVQNENEND